MITNCYVSLSRCCRRRHRRRFTVFGIKALTHRLDKGGPYLDHRRTRLSPNARETDPKRIYRVVNVDSG